jgi:hypothetical protein
LFGENHPAYRRAVSALNRYIAICQTAKHFVFQFVASGVLGIDVAHVPAGVTLIGHSCYKRLSVHSWQARRGAFG